MTSPSRDVNDRVLSRGAELPPEQRRRALLAAVEVTSRNGWKPGEIREVLEMLGLDDR
jgi:hypothetical protein